MRRDHKRIRESAEILQRALDNPDPNNHAWCYFVGAAIREFNEAMIGKPRVPEQGGTPQ